MPFPVNRLTLRAAFYNIVEHGTGRRRIMVMVVAAKKSNSPLAHLIKTDAEAVSFLREGDLVEARFVALTPRSAYFDLGRFGTGVLYGAELAASRQLLKDLAPGNVTSAKVVEVEGEEGLVELSLSGAYEQKNWQEIKEAKETGEILTVKIAGANSGGLVADVKTVKGFLPVSQLATNHYPRVVGADRGKIFEELKKLVGEELKVKILDFNARAGKLILSEREAVEENVKEMLDAYVVGTAVDGIVSGVADFGAFVRFADNPAIEGLVHISELDHRLVDHPKEIVKVGELVKATIVEIKGNQVYLSLKSLKENPWDTAAEKFKEGDEVRGPVYKMTPFGAYITIPHNLQGLIHVSEFGGHEEMRQALGAVPEHEFVVTAVRPEEKRILLRIKKQL